MALKMLKSFSNRIFICKEKILTLIDRPVEDDAFQYIYMYDPQDTIFLKLFRSLIEI